VRSDIKHLRREQLIEATIDTIAKYGFRKTTLSQVAKQAKLSQGIVNFYFKTKDGLLLETLKFLAEEYEASWKRAVAASGPDPVAGLNAIIETDLGREVCNRRKVPVWVAFWGEARSQPRFRKFCSQLADDYFDQTRQMIASIIERGGDDRLDADAIARGLNAMINGLWLDLMIDPKHFEREAAKRACRNYLASVFPAEFAAIGPPVATPRRAG
jgi:TetR/AcrR family transcriptional repressor of bet genes